MNTTQLVRYEPIALSAKSTVVAEFIPESDTEQTYQTEAELERGFILLLQSQAYEYLTIHSEEQLLNNLRHQLQQLNKVTFSENEWQRLQNEYLICANDSATEKTIRIQENHIHAFKRDDGSTKNISLLDKRDIHNNHLQVINQYEIAPTPSIAQQKNPKYANRYDVTILVNGLPLVHIELKRRGVDIREAFNQIDRYQRESFWAGSGLFDYVQLFIISNGTLTKYYSNTTRRQHIADNAGNRGTKKTSNSFEFTSWWADAKNKPIQDLAGFTKTFFTKHTLLAMLTRYCVLTSDRLLLVMRPYQVVATERILQRINVAKNYKKLGKLEAGGYVWHTTGSGKTLTSFKTAQLASRLEGVEKVLFVVDRKDLDYQTMREYDKFETGAANSNASTAILKQQLEDTTSKIIITTIQKLSNFIGSNTGHHIFNTHVVMIFDECHRSQFGDMHKAITKSFKKYNLFGFTGTPIFAQNAGSGGSPKLKTTEQAFGEKLHTYTIVDAINDKNVLPFRIDYVNTIKAPEHVDEKKVAAIDTEQALLDPKRIDQIAAYVLEHYDQKTRRVSQYKHTRITNVAQVASARNRSKAVKETKQQQSIAGFNSMFATASISAAQRYYNAFAAAQEHLPAHQRLKIALIYSFAVNEGLGDEYLDEEGFETEKMDASSRDFLEDAIVEYNEMFGTSYDTSADKFQNYYKDVSLRLKNRELDMVIVVNMFLTGFDATTLNTLWVDKNLRAHGLIQAYSRTNRILNSVKTYGNIVSFRDLEQQTEDAIALFGDREAHGVVLLKPYGEYYGEYETSVQELLAMFPLGETIIGEEAQKQFIQLFGAILRLENILTAFDDFQEQALLSERQTQDYRSLYLDFYAEFRKQKGIEKERINDDVVFEIALIKQVEINVDYVLMLVEDYCQEGRNSADREVLANITRAMDASPSLRNKKDLIEDFVDRISVGAHIDEEWATYIQQQRVRELESIIEQEQLHPEETHKFIDRSFRDGSVQANGVAITKVLPPVSRFDAQGIRAEKKQRVIHQFNEHLERFLGLGSIQE